MIIKVLIACTALAASCSAFAVAPEPAQEAMTVVRDSQTGKLRPPTPAERRALQPPPRHSMTLTPLDKPTSTLRPDGTRAIKLGERGMVYSVMKRHPDGTLLGLCVRDEGEALKVLDAKQEARHDHQ